MPDTICERLASLAVEIQQIPAPTFQEAERAAFIHARFQAEGLEDVSIDELGNVYGRLPGTGKTPPLVVSAHLDTVFPLGTDLKAERRPERIAGPGIGDNSVGTAGLFGLLWSLRQKRRKLPGDLWLVANTGEEGLGNLRGMQAVVKRFKQEAFAFLILEGMALGQIYHRGLGVRRFRVHVETSGGHSWVDYGQPSAVHQIAGLVTHLTAIALPEKPRTTLNIGTISGGTTVNTVAAHAEMSIDIRSEQQEALDALQAEVLHLIEAANQPGVKVAAELIGERLAGEIPAEHALVQLAQRALRAQGVASNLNIGSTDANAPLSQGLPAICIGLTLGSRAHTLGEYIYTQPLEKGLKQVVAVVEGAYREFPFSDQ